MEKETFKVIRWEIWSVSVYGRETFMHNGRKIVSPAGRTHNQIDLFSSALTHKQARLELFRLEKLQPDLTFRLGKVISVNNSEHGFTSMRIRAIKPSKKELEILNPL